MQVHLNNEINHQSKRHKYDLIPSVSDSNSFVSDSNSGTLTVSEELDITYTDMNIDELCANPILYNSKLAKYKCCNYVNALFKRHGTMDPQLLHSFPNIDFNHELHTKGREKLAQLEIIYLNGSFRKLKFNNELGLLVCITIVLATHLCAYIRV